MKRTYLSIMYLFASLFSWGQYFIPENIPTPNAAEMSRYGDVPVSYYTGRANISILLFSTEVKGIPCPISLDYDTSGILLNSLPGWTGQNWNLNVGGVITRSVQGGPDEYTLDQFTSFVQGYFANCDRISQNMSQTNPMEYLDEYSFWGVDLCPDIYTFNFMGRSGKFFLGNDGQWKVQCDDNIDVIFDINDSCNYQRPFHEDLLVPIPLGALNSQKKQPKVIKGFVIRDENGYKYQFGYDDNAIEYTVPIYSIYNNPQPSMINSDVASEVGQWQQPSVPWTATSWYLTEIRDRFDNILYTFHYERGYFIAQFHLSAGGGFLFQKIQQFMGMSSHEVSLNMYGYHDDGTLNSPVYLKDIECYNGTVFEFIRTASPKCSHELYPSLYTNYRFQDKAWNEFMSHSNINKGDRLFGPHMFYYLQTGDNTDIEQYQYLNDNDKCCSFSDSIFPTNDIGTLRHSRFKYYDPLRSTRLCELKEIKMTDSEGTDSISWEFNYDYNYCNRVNLASISLKDNKGNSSERYNFEYNTLNSIPEDYMSTAVDHWGYCNGRAYHDAVPGGLNPEAILACRESNEDYMKRGMLRKVTFPTGGYLELEYEANRYVRYIKDSHQGWNTCQEEKIAGGLRVSKLSEYENNGTLLNRRTFMYSGGELYLTPKYRWSWIATGPYGNNVETETVSSSSVFPLSNLFGPHLGYSQVTESISGGNKIVYHYSNFSCVSDEQPELNTTYGHSLSPYVRYSSHDYMRGKLMSYEVFDNNSNIVDSVNFVYDTEGDINQYYVLASNYILKDTNNPLYKYREGCVYKIYYPRYKETGKTENFFNPDGSVLPTSSCNSWTVQTVSVPSPYMHNVDVCLLTENMTTCKGSTASTKYTYSALDGQYYFLSDFYLVPNEVESYRNNNLIKKGVYSYRLWGTPRLWCPDKYYEEFPDGSRKDVVTYLHYTNKGSLFSYEKDGVIVNLTWDPTENYITKRQDGGLETSYTYNSFGKISSIIYPNNDIEFFSYDSFARLIKTERMNNGQRETVRTHSYKYRNH